MTKQEAIKVWEKILQKVKKDNLELNSVIGDSQVNDVIKNIWEVEIRREVSKYDRRIIFDENIQDYLQQLIEKETGDKVKIEFFELKYMMNYGLDEQSYKKTAQQFVKEGIDYTSKEIIIYANLFFILYEIVNKNAKIEDIIRTFFYLYKLHRIRYYRNDSFRNIYSVILNKKEFSEVSQKDLHILTFVYYYLISTAEIDIKETDFIKEEFNNKDKILKLYRKSKNNKNYLVEEIMEERNYSLQDYLDELQSMIGLEEVKKQVMNTINLAKIKKMRKNERLADIPLTLHMIFTGNPGTGKTTVARLLSKIYKEIGILKVGHLIETSRVDLVGQYIGETAIKTNNVIQKAMGGILFIDEAYSLIRDTEDNRDFGKEAIDTLVKQMEDNRNNLIIIAAGYKEEMQHFVNYNPGLKSRFKNIINFKNYNNKELFQIFIKMCNDYDFELEDDAYEFIKEYFNDNFSSIPEKFSNGREVRNIFEEIQLNQANRLAYELDVTKKDLKTIIYTDVSNMQYRF